MYGYLKRLATTAVAYQVAEVASKVIALGLLPVYTRFLTRRDYGVAEVLITLIILASIFLRLGIGEAFVRFHYADADADRRASIARTATGFLLAMTTAAALLAATFAGPLSVLVLGFRDVPLLLIAVLGLWAFTNLELAYALLRVEERTRAYLVASLTNVLLTVGLTVAFVVGLEGGARGLLAGNYIASTLVLLGLWWSSRIRLRRRPAPAGSATLPQMLRFGLPTVPADASVFALNLVDRLYVYRAQSAAAAGLYALAVKLAAVVVIAVRAFQYAWPPLAYSIERDEEAAPLYARVTTYYVLATGTVVVALALLGRWVLRVLAAPAFFPAYRALPWVALGWGLYGLFLIFVVIAGRARVTSRNFPAALAGLAINVLLLVILVPRLGIAGAGIALCGAYGVMLLVIGLLTRRLFPVAFEWHRLGVLVAVLAGVGVGGELVLPAHGGVGLLLRVLALVLIPVLLAALRFFAPEELRRLGDLARAGVRRVRPAAPPGAP